MKSFESHPGLNFFKVINRKTYFLFLYFIPSISFLQHEPELTNNFLELGYWPK